MSTFADPEVIALQTREPPPLLAAQVRDETGRILKLLDERTGDIEDVIAVEKQLSRVREEIEQAQGRLKYLQNRTALATLTISAREGRKLELAELYE